MATQKYKIENKPYFVLFLDIMGQKKELEAIDELYSQNESDEKFFDFFERTYNYVTQLQYSYTKTLSDFISGYRKAGLGEELFNDKDIETLFVSDSAIITFPLSDNVLENLIKFHCILYSTIFCFSECMALEIPLRGGIDIGLCAPMQEKGTGVYGAGLYKAVKLEKKANIPRVIVGKDFHEYITKDRSDCDCSKLIKNIDELYMFFEGEYSLKTHLKNEDKEKFKEKGEIEKFIKAQLECLKDENLLNRYKSLYQLFLKTENS